MTTLDNDPVVIPDDARPTDGDSSLGLGSASSTQSISSSIINYRHENGRTYHRYKDGKYNIPNDEIENERLDLQHHIFMLTFSGNLGLAPPNDCKYGTKRVLDVGTGTGIWVMDYADEHPEAEVIGIDLSPIQPNFVPPNVRFIVDDLEEAWNYGEPFDYIHSRMMNMSIGDWEEYLLKGFENLAPGGYMELQEVELSIKSDDDTFTDKHHLFNWSSLVQVACANLGRPSVVFKSLKETMAKVGFVDIADTRFKWPTNGWPKDKKYKELGRWNNENEQNGIEALTLAPFTRGLGWTREEVDIFLTDVRKDFNNETIHAYWPICSIYGKKPDD